MEDDRYYWIGLTLVKGIGAVRFRKLIDYFGNAQLAWEAPAEELRAAGLSVSLVDKLQKIRGRVDLDRVWMQIQGQNIRVLTWLDRDYPTRLLEVSQPPPVLYIQGEMTPMDEWAVAIVGTRRMTAYGRRVADEIAAHLAHNEVTVVSGLARGVDTIAHEAALRVGGRTLAVLGSGVDRIYPPDNRQLAAMISDQGALISDYPLGTPPEALNFPPRNRIISGLSMAVVIAEAGRKSGALITASFAADQGRDVFAVPGSILAPQSKGTNHLIQQGARPLLDPQDILETLRLTQVSQHRDARAVLPSNPVEAKLLETIGDEPVHIDEISVNTALPIDKVSATLSLMELKGMVRQVGGARYIVVRETQSEYRVDRR